MPVHHPLLPRPVAVRPLVRVILRGRPGQRQRRHAVPQFRGEPRRVRHGEIGRQPRRVVVGDVVEAYDADVGVRPVRVGGRTGQPAAVPKAQDEAVTHAAAARDPGQRLMGERTPQPGQHGGTGARQPGREPGEQSGPEGGQFVGDLGLGGGGTMHGRAPRGTNRLRAGGHGTRTTADILIASASPPWTDRRERVERVDFLPPPTGADAASPGVTERADAARPSVAERADAYAAVPLLNCLLREVAEPPRDVYKRQTGNRSTTPNWSNSSRRNCAATPACPTTSCPPR